MEECNVRSGMQGLTKYLISFQKKFTDQDNQAHFGLRIDWKGKKEHKGVVELPNSVSDAFREVSSIQTIASILTCFLQRSMVTQSTFHWKAKATGHIETITTMVHGMTGL